MTEFLVRTFVKNHKDTKDIQVRTGYGLMASIVGVCCNVILFGAKLFAGILINSISVMADAFNNLSDAASSVVAFIGVWMAGKPADKEHPFGHGRIEYIAAYIVVFIIFQVGFSLFKTSLSKALTPEEMSFQPVTIVILIVSVAVKLWLSFFNRTLGERIQSSVMKATAADCLGDVVTTSATIVAITVYGIWGYNIDGIVGIIVSVAILFAGVKIAKETLAPLIGEPVAPSLHKEITEFVESYEGIIGSHDLIVHNYGPSKSMASIHAEVPNNVNVEISHEIVDRIERDVLRRLGVFLVIHMDPVETDNSRLMEFGSMLENVIQRVDSRVSFHDLRLVDGKEQINLIFDLVFPREYDKKKRGRVKEQMIEKVFEIDHRCCLVMTEESSFERE